MAMPYATTQSSSTRPRYLSAMTIARMVDVSERSVRQWIADGKLPVVRFGREVRVESGALERFIAARQREQYGY